MSKETGLGAGYFVDGVDLSGDTSSLSKISKALNPLDFTGIDKFARERLAGKLSGAIDWESFYNPTNAHPTLSTLPRTDRIATYMHKQSVLGTPTANMVLKQMGYDPNRPEDGRMTIKIATLSNAKWLEWCRSITTGKATFSGAANGSGVDFAGMGAPASFGLQAYLQVCAFTGTDATIVLQGSSDDGVGDPYAAITGGGFTTITAAPDSERIETARNLAVERYIRLSVTGTFSNLVCVVSVAVNRAEYII